MSCPYCNVGYRWLEMHLPCKEFEKKYADQIEVAVYSSAPYCETDISRLNDYGISRAIKAVMLSLKPELDKYDHCSTDLKEVKKKKEFEKHVGAVYGKRDYFKDKYLRGFMNKDNDVCKKERLNRLILMCLKELEIPVFASK